MMIPIRCMTCGKPVGHLWEKYQKQVARGANPKKVLDSLGVERYCCRSLFLTHVDMVDKIGKFKK
jgi:DNA-directed RNA polymerase subunit N